MFIHMLPVGCAYFASCIMTLFIPKRRHWTHWLPKLRWPGLNGTQNLRPLTTTHSKRCLHLDALCPSAPPRTPEHRSSHRTTPLLLVCLHSVPLSNYTHTHTASAGHSSTVYQSALNNKCMIELHHLEHTK